ncbi:uncharacterized protein LOC121401483 [Xenopus laevis]|nr:uncharacterized protein LOC121401483 [Xenopus laevis]
MALPGHAVHNIPRQPVPSLVSSHIDLEENAVTKQADIAQDEKNADTANDTQTDKEELKNTQMFSLASHSKDYERCKQTISYCSCVLNEPSGLPVDGTSTISGGSEESGLSGRMSSCSTIYRSSSTSISQLRSASLSLSVGDASGSEEASGTYPVTGHKKPILAASGYCKSIQNPCLNSCSFHGNTELHQTSSYSKIKCSEVSRLESSFVESWHDHHLHHWPVLPPISSQRDFSGSRSGDDPSGRRSHMSAVSSGLQDTFDELEMIVPQTGSSLSNSYVGSLSSSEICKTAASLDLGCYDSNEESLTDIRLSLLNHSNWGQEDHNYEANDDEWEGKTHTFTDIHTQGPLLLLAPAIESVTETSDTYPNKRVDVHQNIYTMLTGAEEIKLGVRKQSIHQSEEDIREMLLLKSHFLDSSCSMKGQLYGKDASKKEEGYDLESNRTEEEQLPPIMRRRPVKMDYSIKEEMEKQRIAEERRMQAASIYSKLQKARSTAIRGTQPISISKFEDFDFLAKYCIFSQEKLAEYKRAFEAVDSDGDGYLDCLEVLMALKEIVPPGALSDAEELYVYRILEIVDYYVTDGLTDLRLFAVMASLAQKIAALDSFMRSLIDRMDFKTLELKMYKAKQLFLCNIDLENKISVAQLLVELKAGGISQQHEEAIQMELQHIKRLDILDFLTYLPLFVLIHKSVISNPLDDSRTI